MSDELVQVGLSGSGDAKVYHTESDCSALKNIDNPQDISLESLTNEWRECGYCSGDHDPTKSGPAKGVNPSKTKNGLLETDPEELGLSPLGERPDGGTA